MRSVVLLLLACLASPLFAADPTPEQIEHFEKKVRPVLVEHCYKCHSEEIKKPKGGLRVDGRAHLIEGGDSGTSIVPGNPDKSKFIEAIRYKNPDLQMPQKSKLPDAVIADLEKWVKDGAVWPDDKRPVEKEPDFDVMKLKKEHWAWDLVKKPELPKLSDTEKKWVRDSVDAFVLAGLKTKKLQPAKPAEKLVWLRRVHFALIGLPPTPAEQEAFLKDESLEAYAKVVDRLLESPQFGVRWARHWLDLTRYAETRGHEFEPEIPNAWQYRDYVVRALNADVPYNQFAMEHIAGDVLPKPRFSKNGTNESIIGSGYWHLGEEVHSPVDLRQDQADRWDNRIDVMTKTFLGLTVSCARCHNHKFDAISIKDYYALFGLLEGSGFRLARADGWRENRDVAEMLARLRKTIHEELAQSAQFNDLPPTNAAYETWLKKAETVLDFSKKDAPWLPDDVTFGDGPRPAGMLSVRTKNGKPTLHAEEYTAAVFDRFWDKLKLAPDSAKDSQALGRMVRAGFSIRTQAFDLQKKSLFYLVRGGGMAYAAVNGHTVIAGPLHGALLHSIPNQESYRWVRHDMTAYVGQRLHVELTADPKTDFAVAAVVQADEAPPTLPPTRTVKVTATEKVLGNLAEKQSLAEKDFAENAKWESRLVLAQWDGPGIDGKVFIRGNPRSDGKVVPRRSLEALAGTERINHKTGSGRLELAKHLTDPNENPFISRVIVNRIWHHLFGRGLVASVDNFGVLGEKPTHPELLDHLATEFVEQGWSLKKMIRRLVLSSTYLQSSTAEAAADEADPTNVLLHKFPLRRLDGEAIRDSILAISGRLDTSKQSGPSTLIYLTPFLDGRGRPASGPLDGNGRRSLFLAVRRNFLSPFMLAFDTPIPFSTVGRRQVSNVPAQALILMNDPFVHQQADVWAKAILAKPGDTEERIRGMYLSAYGRPASKEEVAKCAAFVKGKENDKQSWTDLCHTLFNLKEFIFVK